MTDQERPSPEQEARVRRLLAEVRTDEATPSHVVRRLDKVLEGLATEPADPTSPTIDLAARHRRHRVTALLVAAAVVFVAGIGIDRALDGSGPDAGSVTVQSDNDAAGEADESQAVPDRAGATNELNELAEPTPVTPRESPQDRIRSQLTDEVSPYAVRLGGAGGLNRAVSRILSLSRGVQVGDSGFLDLQKVAADSDLTLVGDFACTPAAWGPGRLVPVFYKGTPNVLAIRAPEGETQIVEVLQCGTGEVVRSLTLPRG